MKSKDEVDLYSFVSLADVDQRLRRSICKHKPTGKWVQIEQVAVAEGKQGFTFYGATYSGEVLEGNIKELDYACPTFGLFNDNSNKVRLAIRKPARQYKGGINTSCVYFQDVSTEENHNFFHCHGFYDMLDGKYPNLVNTVQQNLQKDTPLYNFAFKRFNWVSINEFKIVSLYFMKEKVISFTSKGLDVTPSTENKATIEFNREFLSTEIEQLRSILK